VTRLQDSLRASSDEILRPFGLVLRKRRHSFPVKRASLLRLTGSEVVLDVGANVGQYGREIRAHGFRGRIISFEPLPDAFAILRGTARRDPLWEVRQLGLAATDGSRMLNVAGNSVSSSFLLMTRRHLEAAPESSYTHTIEVPVARLDSLEAEVLSSSRPHLKLDVQGYEMEVLRGSVSSLGKVASVEIEVSFEPLYEGQASMAEILRHLDERGFQLVWLERSLLEPRTGFALQGDALFRRRKLG
jgi:FkbM family methyltransferase